MISTGSESQTSELQTRKFKGAFGGRGTGSARRLSKNLESLLGQEAEPTPFGGTTAAQDELLNFLTGEANRRTSVRGLGPASAGDIAQNIAPALIGFREQEEQRRLGRRGQDIQGLLELIGLAMPQVVGGQATTGTGKSLTLGPSSVSF